mgnify:CR=1 FL=1
MSREDIALENLSQEPKFPTLEEVAQEFGERNENNRLLSFCEYCF